MPYCDYCDRWLNGIDNRAADPVNDAVCIWCEGEDVDP